jgi:hypothetical protein
VGPLKISSLICKNCWKQSIKHNLRTPKARTALLIDEQHREFQLLACWNIDAVGKASRQMPPRNEDRMVN